MENKLSLDTLSFIFKPIYKAIFLAFEKCEQYFPNNNGKIYLSNLLGFFVNEKNHDEIKSKCGVVPSLNKRKLFRYLERLNSVNLVKLIEGSRNAIYAYFNKDLYIEYFKAFNEVSIKERIPSTHKINT